MKKSNRYELVYALLKYFYDQKLMNTDYIYMVFLLDSNNLNKFTKKLNLNNFPNSLSWYLFCPTKVDENWPHLYLKSTSIEPLINRIIGCQIYHGASPKKTFIKKTLQNFTSVHFPEESCKGLSWFMYI